MKEENRRERGRGEGRTVEGNDRILLVKRGKEKGKGPTDADDTQHCMDTIR
jgi:hypothetical protein